MIPRTPLRLLAEGPSESCIIRGIGLGWTNCTPASVGMGVSKATAHVHNPDACTLRRLTGDISGGTALTDYDEIVRRYYGVHMEVRTGSNACTPEYAVGQLHGGRGFAVQGNCSALLNTSHRSTATRVNHCVYVNHGRGWHANARGLLVPSQVKVYDPAADGRRAGWGKAADGPEWWSWELLLRFASELNPWGDGDPRELGPGKFFAALFPSTEPHVHLMHGGQRTLTFPRRMVVNPPGADDAKQQNVRRGPSRKYRVVDTLQSGAVFMAYQFTEKGQDLDGSRRWYGDHNGTRWVHSSGLE